MRFAIGHKRVRVKKSWEQRKMKVKKEEVGGRAGMKA